jgi:hypothetical protein
VRENTTHKSGERKLKSGKNNKPSKKKYHVVVNMDVAGGDA